jgi:anti-sigma B factor antagonist
MNITTSRINGTTVLLVVASERVDAHNSDQLKEALRDIFAAGVGQVVVDLQQVRFMDSSGLGALVSGYKNAATHRGRLVLAGLQEQVASMFELTRLSRVFDIFPVTDDALANLLRE